MKLTFSLAPPLPAVYVSAGIVRLNINFQDWAQFSLMELLRMFVQCVLMCLYKWLCFFPQDLVRGPK